MILAVISPETDFKNELEAVCTLLDNGLEYFHLRKPTKTAKELENYIKQIPEKYLGKVILHTHCRLVPTYKLKGIHINKRQPGHVDKNFYNGSWSSSVHNFEELMAVDNQLDYVFLSPVYESISKPGYTSMFSDKQKLKESISNYHNKKSPYLLALGGVDLSNLSEIKTMGFDGAACMGAIWQNAEEIPVSSLLERFKNLKKLCS